MSRNSYFSAIFDPSGFFLKKMLIKKRIYKNPFGWSAKSQTQSMNHKNGGRPWN